jgi:C4-dicarboxylate-specific signal transduction histidine kinase
LGNDASLRTGFANGLPHIKSDRIRLQQVALNLFMNDVEAMSDVSKGAHNLLISTTAKISNAGLWLYEIRIPD